MSSLRSRLVFGLLLGVTLFFAGNGFVIYAIVRARMYSEVDRSLVTLAHSRALSTAVLVGKTPRAQPRRFQDSSLVGVAFAPWIGDQDPSAGASVAPAQLEARLRLIAADAAAVRTYGVGGGMGPAGAILHELGKQAVIGAWIDADPATNEEELETLIRLANDGHVDVAVVGNEVLTRGDQDEAALRAMIARVRAAVPEDVAVVTADTHDQFLAHPDVVRQADFLLVNSHPYWAGVPVEEAVQALACQYEQLVDVARGKRVVIGEAGWPSAGPEHGAAVASLENARRFLAEFVTWARYNDVEYCYFSAIDEPWKGLYGNQQEAHWGYRENADGALKAGFQGVFDSLAGSGPEPGLELVSIPALGSEEDLVGRVSAVGTMTHRIAVCIHVDGGWWSKPDFDMPLSRIDCDGTWTVDVTTGGLDAQADAIAAFLVPAGTALPLLSGRPDIFDEIRDAALAHEIVER